MNKRLIKELIKYLMKLSFPIIGIVCLIKYWSAELIVDKIHYGIFMLAMMIISIDNNRNDNNQMAAN
jgi:hypothetical protein